MPFDLGQLRQTAQQMAGGIPQNADPGKTRPISGRPQVPGAPPMSFEPPAVNQAQAPDLSMPPPQAAPPQAPIAPAVAMGGGGPPMGAMGGPPIGAPPMGAPMGQGNPAMLQALMQRMQAGGR